MNKNKSNTTVKFSINEDWFKEQNKKNKINRTVTILLIIAIFTLTTGVIWIIWQVNDLAKYKQCLEGNTIPGWCEAVK